MRLRPAVAEAAVAQDLRPAAPAEHQQLLLHLEALVAGPVAVADGALAGDEVGVVVGTVARRAAPPGPTRGCSRAGRSGARWQEHNGREYMKGIMEKSLKYSHHDFLFQDS